MRSKERPEILLAIAGFCLLTTSFLPFFFKTLFVEPTGNISLVSPWVAGLLLLGLIYKKSWARRAILLFAVS